MSSFMPNIYVIGGCNGAGKTTASLSILPALLNCQEFVNADAIAAGLSPLNPDAVAVMAGRIMLERMQQLRVVDIRFRRRRFGDGTIEDDIIW
jgi:predicted ABC-type ATPase